MWAVGGQAHPEHVMGRQRDMLAVKDHDGDKGLGLGFRVVGNYDGLICGSGLQEERFNSSSRGRARGRRPQ